MAVSRSRLLVTGALCRRGLGAMGATNRCASLAIRGMAVVGSAPDRPRSWSSTRLDATLVSFTIEGRWPECARDGQKNKKCRKVLRKLIFGSSLRAARGAAWSIVKVGEMPRNAPEVDFSL